MRLLDLFRRPPPSAQVAKERLRIIVAQERSARGGPDYLPLLRRELLEVIRKYVNVDPKAFQGTWSGKYANNQAYTVAISDVSGFHAKVKYQSGSTVLYQDVLIRDNAFRIGDSKFTLVRPGVAQIKTVMTDPASGASTLETSYANQG